MNVCWLYSGGYIVSAKRYQQPRGVQAGNFQGGGGGVVLNGILRKLSNSSDLFPDTLYRKCIKKKKGGGVSKQSTPSDAPAVVWSKAL